MADLAFLPLPIFVTPLAATPAVTAPITATPIAADAADPFASLLATIGETAPASPTATPLVLVAAPTLPVATPADSPPDPDVPMAADDSAGDDDHQDAPATAPPSPLGEITAMLALVPPPPAVAGRVAPPPVEAQPARPATERSIAPLAIAPDAAGAKPAAPEAAPTADRQPAAADAPPGPPRAGSTGAAEPRHDAATAVLRMLRGGASLGAIAGPQADAVASVTTPDAAMAPTALPIAAAAPGDTAPVAPRPALAAVRDTAPTPQATPAATEAVASAAPRAPRRAAPAAPAALDPQAIAPRADIHRPAAEAIAATLPADDPVARQLGVTRDGQWLDTLARDIAAFGGNDGQLRFRLDPDHLGALTVAISQSDDGASLRLTASTEQARSILADAQPRLIAEARAQGLHLREATVDTHAPAPSNGGGAPGDTRGGGGDRSGPEGQLAQQQQQGRRQPLPEAERAPRPRPMPARDAAPAPVADLYA